MKTAKELAEQIYYRRTQMNALDAKDQELIEYFADLIKDYSDQQNKELREKLAAIGVSHFQSELSKFKSGEESEIQRLTKQNKELRELAEKRLNDAYESMKIANGRLKEVKTLENERDSQQDEIQRLTKEVERWKAERDNAVNSSLDQRGLNQALAKEITRLRELLGRCGDELPEVIRLLTLHGVLGTHVLKELLSEINALNHKP